MGPKVDSGTLPECQRDPRRCPWGDIGLHLGALGRLWVTFGIILDISGRLRGHFSCKALEPRKTKDSIGKTWFRRTRGRLRCGHFGCSWTKNLPKVDTRAPKTCQKAHQDPKKRQQRSPEGAERTTRPPKSEKSEIWGVRRGGGGPP